MGEPGRFLLFSWQNRKASNKILQVKGRGWGGTDILLSSYCVVTWVLPSAAGEFATQGSLGVSETFLIIIDW